MRAIVFPSKYYQGPGTIRKIGQILETFGSRKPMIIWGRRAKASAGPSVMEALGEENIEFEEHILIRDCTKAACREIMDQVTEKGCDIVAGIGGGKVLDMAKAVAGQLGLRVIIVPTIASNDAATTACTVWYNEEGVHVGASMWPSNPDVVISDTEILIRTPVRMLKAGLGDTLATNIEAVASGRKENITRAGGKPTRTVKALAQTCFDILITNGEAAIEAVEKGQITPEFEDVVEASVLLSGVGWESGGLCTAHELGNGLPDLPETHAYMHGEKVALGIVTELMLDRDIGDQEKYRIVGFMAKNGLPVCFEDLNMQDISRERLYAWCVDHTGEGSYCHHHAFPVTADDLYQAMLAADRYGLKLKQELKQELKNTD